MSANERLLYETFEEGSIEEKLRIFWRTYPHHIEISKVLADKIQTLQENRSLEPESFKNLLLQIQKYILLRECWNESGEIPKFITEIIYQLDTLSIEEIEYRLFVLEQVSEKFC